MPAFRAAAGVTALSALALALAPRPPVDNAVTSWFSQRDPALAAYQSFQAAFGADDVVVAVVEGDPAGALRQSVALGEALAEHTVVERTLSAGTLYPSDVELLLDPELGGLENLEFVGWRFDGPLNRSLKLFDPQAGEATVYALLKPGSPAGWAAVGALLEEQRAAAEAAGLALHVAGQPLVNVELDRASVDVERQTMPLLVAVCALLLLAATRSPRRAFVLLGVVGLGVFASEGLLALWGGTSNLIVTVSKPLLFVLLLATGYHVLVAWVDARHAGQAPWPAGIAAARHKASACLLALGTTAVGFGSLAVSDVGPIRTFGLVTAAGLTLGAPLLLVLFPALLGLLGGGAGLPVRQTGVGHAVRALVVHAQRRPAPWLLVGLLVSVGGVVCAQGLESQPHAIEYLPTDHPLRRDHQRLEQLGRGLASLEVVVRGERPLITDVAALESLDAWSRTVCAWPGVRGSVSPTLILREAVYRTARADRLPDALLLPKILAKSEEPLAPYEADGGRALRFTFAIDTLGPEQVDALEARLREALPPALQAGAVVTGNYPLLLHTQTSLLSTLWSSLALTAVLMQLVLGLGLRSWRLALAGVLPNVVPVAAVFVLLRAAGVPLDVGTSMSATVALGIAVDDTLHMLSACRREGLVAAAFGSGRAVVFSSVVIALGFSSVLTAEFAPTRNFGLLCAVGVSAALLGDLLVLPASLWLFGAPTEPPAADAEPQPAAVVDQPA